MEKDNKLPSGRKKKILLLLPLVLLPFVTILFWALGGGSAEGHATVNKKGFNIKLPSAQLQDDKGLDKLNYYEQASTDSTKLEDMRRKDPNYRFAVNDSSAATSPGGLRASAYQSSEETKVYQKLEELKNAVNKPIRSIPAGTAAPHAEAVNTSGYEAQLAELLEPTDSESQPDSELQQLSGMLESILDLQYPERMEQKVKEQSAKNRGLVYAVGNVQEPEVVGSLRSADLGTQATFGATFQHTGFYGLEAGRGSIQDNAVRATVPETQTVVNGSTVKLLLMQDIFVNGTKIPKNTFVYGMASLKGERLAIEITTIRYGASLFPVELTVYDLDGMAGVYIPGAINRDVAKSSAERSAQTLGITTLDDSWGAQAAGAGIEAAKGLFSKKVKLIKVTLKAGYSVLLRDGKQKEN
ncbi:conjugative transposon protein TraM [Flavobacterium sp. RHBU_24]|uniref:conjugative transposon protein TraM n=1 Tax=Flavobacterium sp. RHBU_24 TaxID=3391185 RepID=UPI00398463B8